MVIRILIVAAYAAVRAGLHALLADAEDCAIIGEVSGSAELERILAETRPDVVLYDMNEGDAAQVLEVVAGGESGLVALGESHNGYEMLAELPLSGWAWLLKEAEGGEIAAAIRAAAAGLIALDRSVASLLLTSAPLARAGRAEETALPGETLTAREREVLQLMAQGLPNKNIAARLSISQHTVKFHVASILAKLGAASRTEAVTLGARRGYVLL
jgi:DNA-binding NarL/FixJ family response regulator